MIRLTFISSLLTATIALAQPTTAPVPLAPVQSFLDQGHLDDAAKAMSDRISANPHDDQSRFSLANVQVLQAVEHLSQSAYKFGVRTDKTGDVVRFPIPANPNPTPIKYEDARKIIEQMNADFTKAELTLEPIADSNMKLPLRIGTVQLDSTGTGPTPDSTLWKVLAGMWQNPDINEPAAQAFVINFDQGDVYWLRGYCHLIAAVTDVMLAYDEHDLFDRTAQVFFAKVDSPYPFLKGPKKIFDMEGTDAVDLVAFIHLLHFPLKDPMRLLDARGHLKQVIACSRASWKSILAETDDDHEWIPNPRQHAAIPHVQVTQEMIDGWQKFLDQADTIIDGKALIPFWRGDSTMGVNLAKLFFDNPAAVRPGPVGAGQRRRRGAGEGAARERRRLQEFRSRVRR